MSESANRSETPTEIRILRDDVAPAFDDPNDSATLLQVLGTEVSKIPSRKPCGFYDLEELDWSKASEAEKRLAKQPYYYRVKAANDVDLHELGEVFALDLSGRELTDADDLSKLSGVRMLKATSSGGSMQYLSNLRWLDLTSLAVHLDVNDLGGLSYLRVVKPKGTLDVKSLGGVYALDLSGCNVPNVSALSTVLYLKLNNERPPQSGAETLNPDAKDPGHFFMKSVKK